MIENTNKAIAVNSIISYVQLVVSVVSGLLITRCALSALGVDDFGLFSVVASIISFVAIFNSIMLSTSNRFIAISVGRGDLHEINEQFNINLTIMLLISIIVLCISFPLGEWYIRRYVTYIGEINDVILLFRITIIGSVIASIGVPYQGLLIAKEKFLFFSVIAILMSLLKLILAFSLRYFISNKLLIYGIGVTVLTIIPTITNYIYCNSVLPELVKIRLVRVSKKYKEMFMFSIWVGYGALASIAKSSGTALIVNLFFTSAMNAALGVANSINIVLMNFATNSTKSIVPQITKSYAMGDKARTEMLVCLASRLSFLIMFLISTPFFIAPEYIFGIWLGNVPDYTILFSTLLIVDTLIAVLNVGVTDIVFATGNIKWYQIIENSIILSSILIGYVVVSLGAPVYYLLCTYIIFTIIILFVRQILLNKIVKFNNVRLIKDSFLPSIFIVICYLPLLLLLRESNFHPLLLIVISIVYVIVLIYLIGLSRKEKTVCVSYIVKLCKYRRLWLLK